MQAALLRGFARKRLAEEQGTYKALMGDPSLPDDDADDWSLPPLSTYLHTLALCPACLSRAPYQHACADHCIVPLVCVCAICVCRYVCGV